MYNLDPHGTQMLNGVKVPVILCHQDSYKLGLGGNHADIYHWFTRYGKDMNDVRNDVAKLMGKPNVTSSTTVKVPTTTNTTTVGTASFSNAGFKLGDTVRLIAGAKYASGARIPSWVFEKDLYIRQINGNNAIVSTVKVGAITGVVPLNYLKKAGQFVSYTVRVSVLNLNIRKNAGTENEVIGIIKNGGVYTIVDEAIDNNGNKWGLLKSYSSKRNGWINLGYTKKL